MNSGSEWAYSNMCDRQSERDVAIFDFALAVESVSMGKS